MNNNQIEVRKPKFSVAITTEGYQKLINNTLGDPVRSKRYIAAITSAVAVNKDLQECEAGTILAGSLLGESLNLVHSPQAGHYYLVPFKQKEKLDKKGNVVQPATTKAVFVLGYKGYIQLALRSGQYRRLNVIEIKEGELIRYDPLNEEIECKLIEDFEEREKAPTVGYYAMFEYLNGFRKILYWSKEKMMSHADRYSPAFSALDYKKLESGKIPEKDMWKYSSYWYKDFDGMAKKTMLRQLISKWGIMSVEMATAFESDDSMKTVDMSTGNIVDVEADIPAEEVQYEDAPVEHKAPKGQKPKTLVPDITGEVVEKSLDDF